MIPAAEPLISEFHEEAATTRRLLERVPADKLTWKPHPKSMSLGQLSLHLASIPGNLAKALQAESRDIPPRTGPATPATLQEIQGIFEQGARDLETFLTGLTEEQAAAPWRLSFQGKEVFNRPRIKVVRSVILNHSYHHRGQLSVYLRLLDVPIPVIYGRSADEDPFAS